MTKNQLDVFLVEDNDAFANVAESTFANSRLTTHRATNLIDALRLLRERDWDYHFIDGIFPVIGEPRIDNQGYSYVLNSIHMRGEHPERIGSRKLSDFGGFNLSDEKEKERLNHYVTLLNTPLTQAEIDYLEWDKYCNQIDRKSKYDWRWINGDAGAKFLGPKLAIMLREKMGKNNCLITSSIDHADRLCYSMSQFCKEYGLHLYLHDDADFRKGVVSKLAKGTPEYWTEALAKSGVLQSK
jgi:hypothetical protein